MIYGIGTDIVEVARVEESLRKFGDDFAERILSPSELTSYHDSNIKARFLAKRFAAKEAFSKAIGTGIRDVVSFQNIAIGHDDLGKPLLLLEKPLQTFVNDRQIQHTHITISDEKNLAAAFVVLEK